MWLRKKWCPAAKVETQSMAKTYKLGCRSKGSAIVRSGTSFTFEIKDSPQAKFTFQTANIPFGEERCLPGDLIVIVEGAAQSIEDAEKFANGAAFLTKIVAVAANSYFAPLEPEVIVETTPDAEERGYFQRLVQAGPPVLTARFVSAEAAIALMKAILSHPDREIIMIAINQYVLALSYWGMRQELLVVSHLFMCAETLKGLVLKDIIRRDGVTEEQLAERWEWDKERENSMRKFLNGYCREFEVFGGDRTVSKPAADISNAFEHGYENWNLLYAKAREIVAPMIHYMREAILRVVNVEGEFAEVMRSDLYKNPIGPEPIEFRLRAIIAGSAQIVEDSKHLPIFTWRQTIDAIEIEDSRFSFTTSSHVEAKLPAGLELVDLKLTVEAPDAFDFKVGDGAV